MTDLKSVAEGLAGSSPAERTIGKWNEMQVGEACRRCNLIRTKSEHDPCIPNLPGVKYACCGHGKFGYILFENGVLIRFPILYEIRHGEFPFQDGKEIVYDPGHRNI